MSRLAECCPEALLTLYKNKKQITPHGVIPTTYTWSLKVSASKAPTPSWSDSPTSGSLGSEPWKHLHSHGVIPYQWRPGVSASEVPASPQSDPLLVAYWKPLHFFVSYVNLKVDPDKMFKHAINSHECTCFCVTYYNLKKIFWVLLFIYALPFLNSIFKRSRINWNRKCSPFHCSYSLCQNNVLQWFHFPLSLIMLSWKESTWTLMCQIPQMLHIWKIKH